MGFVVHNERMFEKACEDMYRLLKDKGAFNLDYGEYHAPKTKAQLGFWWSCICGSIKEFFLQYGTKFDDDEIKQEFYNAISPKKKMKHFNLKEYEVPKGMSEMSKEEMSDFIDRSIYICEHSKTFDGMKLHPSIKNVWIRHITENDLKALPTNKFSRVDKEYLQHQRNQSCLVCGCFNDIEAHHIKEAGESGTGYKANDWETVPLCRECHRMYHTKGRKWFDEQVGWIYKYLNLVDYCACCYNRWLNKM